jgi:hypothetical protein
MSAATEKTEFLTFAQASTTREFWPFHNRRDATNYYYKVRRQGSIGRVTEDCRRCLQGVVRTG